jgi:TonB family protein
LTRRTEPTFLLIEPDRLDGRHWAGVAAASVAVHVLLALIIVPLAKAPSVRRVSDLRITPERRTVVTPLIAPPARLTQKEPNTKPLSAEFNVASIAPRPENRVMPSPGAAALPRQVPADRFRPKPQAGVPIPAATIPEAPSLTVRTAAAPPPEALGVPNAPAPPQIQQQEKPKLAFETPGAMSGTANQTGVTPKMQAPRNTVDDAIRQVAGGGGSKGLIVGDQESSPSMAINPAAPSIPVPGKLGSSLELQSDPMGVDFKPYLIRVLSAVKRNWMAVVPESARLGRRGKTVIQFAISKDGTVPKLVIAIPSGAEALDRAAVAGISASNPFPPLPAEFRGSVIRLQLNFLYNLH